MNHVIAKLCTGIVKGTWSKAEDDAIIASVQGKGGSTSNWSEIAANVPGRLGQFFL
jgi:hypothetical protein